MCARRNSTGSFVSRLVDVLKVNTINNVLALPSEEGVEWGRNVPDTKLLLTFVKSVSLTGAIS